MHYIMNHDTPTISIENCKIINKTLAPKSLVVNNLNSNDISNWLQSRALSMNRENAEKIYMYMGLNRDNFMDILYITHGLSINDNYWIADESEIGRIHYESLSLFHNSLNKALYQVALLGVNDKFSIQNDLRSAEFTGQGSYPKCFIRREDGIYLCKHQSDSEIRYEIIAAYIGKIMGFNTAEYHFEKVYGLNCSVSKILSDSLNNWETAFDIAKHMQDMYGNIPQEFAIRMFGRNYTDMVIFDAVVLNDDRHMKNWAFDINGKSGEIAGIAPSYDYNKAFQANSSSMSQLIFNGYKRMNLLTAARFTMDNYGTNLNLLNLVQNIDRIPDIINKEALLNRIYYITRRIDSQKYCY